MILVKKTKITFYDHRPWWKVTYWWYKPLHVDMGLLFIILTDLFISWHNYIFHYGLRWDPMTTSSAAVLPKPLSREDGGPSHSGSVPPKPVFDRDGKWSLHRTSQWALEQRGDQLQYPAPLGEKLLAAFPSPSFCHSCASLWGWVLPDPPGWGPDTLSSTCLYV